MLVNTIGIGVSVSSWFHLLAPSRTGQHRPARFRLHAHLPRNHQLRFHCHRSHSAQGAVSFSPLSGPSSPPTGSLSDHVFADDRQGSPVSRFPNEGVAFRDPSPKPPRVGHGTPSSPPEVHSLDTMHFSCPRRPPIAHNPAPAQLLASPRKPDSATNSVYFGYWFRGQGSASSPWKYLFFVRDFTCWC
jgi:hypothetical protein